MNPDDVRSAQLLWNLLIILALLISVVAPIVAVYISSRRMPPLREELLEKFSRKDDLEKLRCEFLAHKQAVANELAQGSVIFRDICKSLGKLEGKLDIIGLILRAKFESATTDKGSL